MLVLGPCAAESREQVIATAEQLVKSMPSATPFIFRAGAWKPRTSPDTFQGVGAQALDWLREVRERFALPLATEIATPEQLHLALEAGIDYVWLGARTSANPIQVQQLADELCASPHQPKAVMLKNPVNDDWQLWLGNIHRLSLAHIPVIAVHRGCNHHPCWEMAYRLRLAAPDIPLLLDPSHMAGTTERISDLVATAHNLAYDGLMIEVHCRPADALSDAAQQLTPQQTAQLLNTQSPTAKLTNSETHQHAVTNSEALQLRWLRAMMDEVDDELWQVLLKRMRVSREIGDYKHRVGMPVLQPERYSAILQHRLDWAAENNLSPDTVRQIMSALHNESCRWQH